GHHQDQKWALELLPQIGPTSATRFQPYAGLEVPPPLRRRPVCPVRSGEIVEMPPKEHVHFSLRLRQARARTQTPHHLLRPGDSLAQTWIVKRSNWHPEFGPVSDLNAEKARRRDTDDDYRSVVDCDPPPHHCRIEAESALPEFVADHRRRFRAA